MTPRRSLPVRIFLGVCAVLFLAASGAHPLQLHPCPHHDGPLGMGHGSQHAAAPVGKGHTGRLTSSDGGRSHDPGGPCTCIGDCHASADAPIPPDPPDRAVVDAPAETTAGSLDGGRGPFGPRHHLYQLHLPNAPPVAL